MAVTTLQQADMQSKVYLSTELSRIDERRELLRMFREFVREHGEAKIERFFVQFPYPKHAIDCILPENVIAGNFRSTKTEIRKTFVTKQRARLETEGCVVMANCKLAMLPKHCLEGQGTHLDLSGNNFGHVPSKILQLTKLERLDLSRNSLTNLPDSMKLLENLEELVLFGNDIQEFPERLLQMRALSHLKIDAKSAQFLPAEVFDDVAISYYREKEGEFVEVSQEEVMHKPESISPLGKIEERLAAFGKRTFAEPLLKMLREIDHKAPEFSQHVLREISKKMPEFTEKPEKWPAMYVRRHPECLIPAIRVVAKEKYKIQDSENRSLDEIYLFIN